MATQPTQRISIGIRPPNPKGPLMSEPDKNRPTVTVPAGTPGSVNHDSKWRHIGSFLELSKMPCQRIYCKRGKDHDLALFYNEGRFYCLEAWCSHLGGPLFMGEIEEYKKECHVMCPWHGYMFKLSTGENEIGLRQQTFPVKVENREVFVEHDSDLSLYKFI